MSYIHRLWASHVVLVVKNLLAKIGDKRDVGLIPELGKTPGEGNGNPLSVFLPGESQGQRSLAGYSPWSHKESHMTEHTHMFTYLCNWWSFLIITIALLSAHIYSHAFLLFFYFSFHFLYRKYICRHIFFLCVKWKGVDFITVCNLFGGQVIWKGCWVCVETVEVKIRVLKVDKIDSWKEIDTKALFLGAPSRKAEEDKYVREQSPWKAGDWWHMWAAVMFVYSVKKRNMLRVL